MTQESKPDSAQTALPFFAEGPEANTVNEFFLRSGAVRSRENLRRFLGFLRGAQNRSLFNNMLLFVQCPSATLCATATQWKALHRRPLPSARPLIILAPRTPVLLLYDVADTEGRPLPNVEGEEAPRPERIAGATQLLTQNAARYGLRVKHVSGSLLHPGRVVRPQEARGEQYALETCKLVVEVESRLDEAEAYAALVEQLARVLLGHYGGDEDRWWTSRMTLSEEQKALEADCVRYLVCGRTGLPLPWADDQHACLDDPYTLATLDVNLLIKRAAQLERMATRTLPTPASRARR